MMTTMQRPTATTVSAADAQRLRLAALLDLARERDDEPDLDYPELVVLLEAEARRQKERRRHRRP